MKKLDFNPVFTFLLKIREDFREFDCVGVIHYFFIFLFII